MSSEIIKPYELQITDNNWPDDDQIDDWLDSLDRPIFNMVVGPSKCGKTTFIKNYGLQSRGSKATAVRRTSQNVTDPLVDLNIIDRYWTDQEIVECVLNEEAIIFDAENLARKERERILKLISPDYFKVAIIWELSDEELLRRGCSQSKIEEKDVRYERPNSDEDIDELVYIFS